MTKLVVSEFITLDGVIEDPGGAEDFAHGGWAFRFDRGSEGDAFKLDEVTKAGALLLGRRTYEGFAAAWPSRDDEVGFAEKMNSMPKVVLSSTLQRPEWNNSTVLAGDLVQGVSQLKRESGGEILVNGSAQLARGLAEGGLVDEYRLMVFPVVLGDGKRLFADGAAPAPLRAADVKRSGECVILVYERSAKQAA